MTGHEGGCACGGVRYRMAGEPMFVHACHCKRCQRLSGAAYGVNAPIESDRVAVLKGAIGAAEYRGETGMAHISKHCPDCGVTLWTHHPAFGPRIALVAVGTLDETALFAPRLHCFVRFKLPWVCLPADVPAFDGTYDPTSVWPADSLARLRACAA
jgi:hypothetical protein